MASAPTGLEKTFSEWFVDKAPFQIPDNARVAIAKWSPWITLVLLILAAPALLAILGLGAAAGVTASALGVVVSPLYYVSLLVLAVQLVVMAISIPGLMKLSYSKGWKLVYYSTLVSFAYGVVSAISNGALFSIISAAIGTAISLYVLFQIRGQYS